jgi:hypothetical protein
MCGGGGEKSEHEEEQDGYGSVLSRWGHGLKLSQMAVSAEHWPTAKTEERYTEIRMVGGEGLRESGSTFFLGKGGGRWFEHC